MAAELLQDMRMAGALLGIALVLAALAAWMLGGRRSGAFAAADPRPGGRAATR